MGDDETRYMTLAEVKDLINSQAESRELNYEQTLALTHAEKFADMEVEDAKKLLKELEETFEFMPTKLAYKTVDILPQDKDGVRAIFSRDRFTPSEDDCKEIIKVIKKYL